MQEQELPELDDEFAQTASEFDSLDELRDDVAARLANTGRLDQAAKARDAVLENLLAQLEIDLPENVIGTEIDARKTQIQSQLDSASIDLDEYLAETGEAEDAESFWAGVEKRSADALKAQLVLDKTAEETEVSVDQNDLTQHIFQRAQQEGHGAAADHRPHAGAPAPHRRVHARDPSRQGAGRHRRGRDRDRQQR